MIKKMTNAEMISRVNGIVSIQNKEEKECINIFGTKAKLLYAITKNKHTMVELLKPYEESLKKIMDECHVRNLETENGIKMQVENEFIEKWNEKVNELKNIEVEVPVHMVNIDAVDGSDLSITEFEYIDFMIDDSE